MVEEQRRGRERGDNGELSGRGIEFSSVASDPRFRESY